MKPFPTCTRPVSLGLLLCRPARNAKRTSISHRVSQTYICGGTVLAFGPVLWVLSGWVAIKRPHVGRVLLFLFLTTAGVFDGICLQGRRGVRGQWGTQGRGVGRHRRGAQADLDIPVDPLGEGPLAQLIQKDEVVAGVGQVGALQVHDVPPAAHLVLCSHLRGTASLCAPQTPVWYP